AKLISIVGDGVEIIAATVTIVGIVEERDNHGILGSALHDINKKASAVRKMK
ncbi:MAG: hypothetical protein H6Q37_612, partial [Chloroflexi bacterium]|nr:hypothetical protein [Chloroflexota bacterium]